MVALSEIRLIQVETDKITPDPRQPRKIFDDKDLLELGRSMKSEGQKYPLRCQSLGDGRYRIIGGQRRWMAAKLVEIPLLYIQVIEKSLTEIQLIIDQLTDNLTYRRLNILEQAEAFQKLSEDGGLTYKEIAALLHISEGTISRALTCNGCLAPELRDLVLSGKLPAHEAYLLATVKNKANQLLLAEEFSQGRLDRAQLQKKCQEEKGKTKTRRKEGITLTITIGIDANYKGLIEFLQQKIAQLKKAENNQIPFDMVGHIWKADA